MRESFLAFNAYATASEVMKAVSAGLDLRKAKPFDSLRLGHAVSQSAKRSKVEKL
jgi:hypothetical protein